jgi:hypothetical protein
MTGEGMAAILASLATLVTAAGGIIVQLRGQAESRVDRADLRDKVDENTALTKDTAAKVEVVHAATTAIVEATGTHQTLKDQP